MPPSLFDPGLEHISVAETRLSDLETNVEFYTAASLHGVGVPQALFTPTFAVARSAGWMAHCLERLDDNRLVRPVSRYVGDRDRSWTPVDER